MVPSPKDERVRVRHMLEAALKAQEFTRGRARSDLDSDEVLALALVRLLEIVGEAAKAVPPSVQQIQPDIPWSQIARTRDRLIHAYFSVDLNIVWQIVAADLPSLVQNLEALLDTLDQSHLEEPHP